MIYNEIAALLFPTEDTLTDRNLRQIAKRLCWAAWASHHFPDLADPITWVQSQMLWWDIEKAKIVFRAKPEFCRDLLDRWLALPLELRDRALTHSNMQALEEPEGMARQPAIDYLARWREREAAWQAANPEK